MRRILFIATCDMGKRTGGGLANLAYYNAFKHLFPCVVDLAMAEENCIGMYADVIHVPRRGFVKKIIGIVHGEFHRNLAFFRHYVRAVAGKYSCCVINGGVYAGDMINLFHEQGIKVIVIHHNFEREYHLGNRSWKTLWGLNATLLNRIERNAFLKSDLNCYITAEDKRLFHKYYGDCRGREYILGVFEPSSVSLLPMRGEGDSVVRHIIVSGSMNSTQTITGIMDFKERYYSILEENYKDWNVIFAGRNPGEEIFGFCDEHSDRLSLIPNPPVMDEVIDRGSIFLCPTNVGGGLKLRLMDALRRGMPVLTHEVSARGYDVFFGYPFFQVYHDEDSFKKGLETLVVFMRDNENWQSDILRIYVSHFGFDSGCDRVFEAISLLSL